MVMPSEVTESHTSPRNAVKSSIAPLIMYSTGILTLPFDMMRKIFLYLVPTLSERLGTRLDASPPLDLHVVHPYRLQNTLSLVCSRWTEYVHSIPGLWAIILLDRHLTSLTQLARKLDRSHDAPLHIYVNRGFLPSKDQYAYIRRTAHILRPHLSRAVSLFFGFGDDNFILGKLPSCLADKSGLLSIPMARLFGMDGPGSKCLTSGVKIHAPSLQRLNFAWEAGKGIDVTTTFHTVRHLTMRIRRGRFKFHSHALNSLTNSPNLESLLWISQEPRSRDPPIILDSLRLSKLKTLIFDVAFPDDSLKIFANLEAPALDSLTIKGRRWTGDRYKPTGFLALQTLLGANLPNLHYLYLHDMEISAYDDVLRRMWGKCNKLERITVLHCRIGCALGVLGQPVSAPSSRHILCPNLCHLYFHASTINIDDLEQLLNGVLSNLRVLSSVKILNCKLSGRKAIAKFNRLFQTHEDLITFVVDR
ncbi:hypothetical protein M422DRAFT_49099 [Sphaerobolus stellatus SS14]|uniref:F-box domain-containing protein n=1 Tax=Sphaerobolus stellatus (strain SS14) TaxID=990650 RepID=A0A0C9VRG1_SPHS4|nr:hypothetical protein M422DRAFT_49099 [Sphaerobolus stellatus SS14]